MNDKKIDLLAAELGSLHDIMVTLYNSENSNNKAHEPYIDDNGKVLVEYALGAIESAFRVLQHQ